MRLHGFFDTPSVLTTAQQNTTPSPLLRTNKWTAQHKANLRQKAAAKKTAKRKKTVAAAPKAAPVVTQAVIPAAPVAEVKKPNFWEGLATTAQQAIPAIAATVAAAKQQKRIDKLQQQKIARDGVPYTADEISAYMDATAPTIKVKGGVDDNTRKYLFMGGLAIAGVLFLTRSKASAKA